MSRQEKPIVTDPFGSYTGIVRFPDGVNPRRNAPVSFPNATNPETGKRFRYPQAQNPGKDAKGLRFPQAENPVQDVDDL